eukprot:656608-Pelagomonas_calceolata.AAC.1
MRWKLPTAFTGVLRLYCSLVGVESFPEPMLVHEKLLLLAFLECLEKSGRFILSWKDPMPTGPEGKNHGDVSFWEAHGVTSHLSEFLLVACFSSWIDVCPEDFLSNHANLLLAAVLYWANTFADAHQACLSGGYGIWYGMVLKQRANFYNNIATEMIPCQKPMLLQDAMDFEKVWGSSNFFYGMNGMTTAIAGVGLPRAELTRP